VYFALNKTQQENLMRFLFAILIALSSFSAFSFDDQTIDLVRGNYGTDSKDYCGFKIIPNGENLTAVAINNPFNSIRCGDAGDAISFQKGNVKLRDGRSLYTFRKLCSSGEGWCMVIEVLDNSTFIMHASGESYAYFLN
jgi:hypothetical protein